jgi:hypothetical protein
MASLEINFQCMCLFVPVPRAPRSRRGTVHVLMPTTCCRAGGADIEEHVVKLIHDDTADPKGVSLAGHKLELGAEPGSANLSLKPRVRTQEKRQPEIVNLTRLTRLRVPQALLSDGAGKVNARVVLRGGYLKKLAAEKVWQFGTRDVFMAHRMTWRIDGISKDQVNWTGPDGKTVAGPVDILGLTPVGGAAEREDKDRVIRFGIYHQPDRVLEVPRSPKLDPREVTEHFRAFYAMFGVRNADAFPLPRIEDAPPGMLVDCGGALALPA